MSEVKVNKISPRSGTGVQLGDSGDTSHYLLVTIPSGATINNQGTATNFGATGSASWTTTVKTSTFTAVAGEGYFVNTTGGAVTVNLPAGVAGAVVAVKDYAGTFDTNAVTLVQNGSDKIGGSTDNKRLGTEGIAATLIFIDSTQGWLVTDDGLQSSLAGLTYSADFLVIAGGGAGGSQKAGGGGAGGYRASFNSETSGGGGSSETALQLSPGTTYTITVGGGGAGVSSGPTAKGNDGVASSITGSDITDITTVGGGGGGNDGSPNGAGRDGGSGGGAGGNGPNPVAGGSGTTNQGFDGGNGYAGPSASGGGGGGAGAVGVSITGDGQAGGNGGTGVASTITGSSVTRAGGGGGINESSAGSGSGGSGGGGGGANGGGSAGSTNTGSGGGATHNSGNSGAGGSGVVVLRVATSDYSSTTTGSPTVSTSGSDTIMVFNSSGSYTG